MNDDCIVAISFHVPQLAGPVRFYSDADLAILWNMKPRTIRNWRWLAKRHGCGPPQGQYRYRRPRGTTHWHIEVSAMYAAFLQDVFVTRVKQILSA